MRILPILLFCIISTPALAAEDDKGIFNVVIENDFFAGEDRDYTNGIRLSWLSSEKNTPQWEQDIANILPLADEGDKRVSIAFGQNMYTPQNTLSTTPIAGDRPYAGWLYGSVGMVSDTGNTLDNAMITLGVVGPAALAEQTQRIFHNIISDETPKGWDNQLKNEPGIVLTYERKWKEFFELSTAGLEADIMPHVGVNLGNINTDAAIGATFRLGFDLPADYGPPRIRPSLPGSDFFVPSEDLSGYLFTSVGERAVARNIFLDGNTFASSESVDKENFVSSLQVGAVLTSGDSRISYTQVFMSKEYKTQTSPSQFGTLTFSYRF
jgi:lipid A 3-O-deacylase